MTEASFRSYRHLLPLVVVELAGKPFVQEPLFDPLGILVESVGQTEDPLVAGGRIQTSLLLQKTQLSLAERLPFRLLSEMWCGPVLLRQRRHPSSAAAETRLMIIEWR